MRKETWIFLLKLSVASIVLGLFWFYYFQMAYPRLLQPVFIPLFELLDIRKWRLYQLLDHFTNLIVFIALMLATPDLIREWKKSLLKFTGGILILVFGHFLISWIDYYYYAQYQQTKQFFRSTFHYYLINDALPFIIWLLFYPHVLTRLFPFLKFGKARADKTREKK